MSAQTFAHGSPALRAWLWSMLKDGTPALIACGRLSRNKARKYGLIPNPYRPAAVF